MKFNRIYQLTLVVVLGFSITSIGLAEEVFVDGRGVYLKSSAHDRGDPRELASLASIARGSSVISKVSFGANESLGSGALVAHNGRKHLTNPTEVARVTRRVFDHYQTSAVYREVEVDASGAR